MLKISLRKLKKQDKKYFSKWWRDKDLIALTSGVFEFISDEKLEEYFLAMLKSKKDLHFMIFIGMRAIGHISLMRRRNDYYETQIIIGEKSFWGKGYGTKTIKLVLRKAKKLGISKIYLEVCLNNIRAIKAYQKCGFEKDRIKKHPKNKYLPVVLRMRLN